MTVHAAISAFALRGARRGEGFKWLAYSGGLAGLCLLLAHWICSAEPVGPVDGIPWSTIGLADVFAVYLLGIGAFVLAPALVAATVAEERRQGTLDQLRTTPLPPLALLAGLVVGAPARLYLLCAGPLALHAAAALFGELQPDALVASTVVLLVGALATSAGALCLAMARRQESAGGLVALGVAALGGIASLVAVAMAGHDDGVHWAFLHPAGALDAAMLMHDGLWRRLMVSTWALERFSESRFSTQLAITPALGFAFSLVVGVLLARAACRKLERPHLPLFSKLQAVMLFAIVTVALILPLDLTHQGERIGREVPFVFGLFLLPVATLLCGLATPEFEAWALALRKGTDRRGFGDEASSQGAVALMWATFLVFLYYKLHRHGFPSALRVSDGIAFAWGSWLALAMPIFLLYGSTRFPTAGARFAFGTATAAYTIFEMVALAIFLEENGLPGRHDAIARLVVELGALLAVGVPLLVALRQRRMRRAIVDGS